MNGADTRDDETDFLVTRAGTAEQVVDLVDESPASSQPTFDEMLARYKDEVYRYAAHLTRTRAGADDLYQETLHEAYCAFDQLNRPANHRTWLYMLATNAFLNDRRTRGREEPSDEERADWITEAARDHAARLDAHDLLSEVEAFVAALPRKQWVALVQRKYHSLSYAEITASLGGSEATAQANVHTALRSLRDHLGDRM